MIPRVGSNVQKTAHTESDLDALLAAVKEGTRRAEEALERTIANCDESNERMRRVDEWMREVDNYGRET